MRIIKDNSLAVIIDVQERLFPHMHEKEKLEKNLGILINGFKILNLPVIVTEQYTKGLGMTIPSLKMKLDNYPFFEKTAFSCCDEKNFMKTLKESKSSHIIIAGIESHVCILQTTIDLIQNNFIPVVIEDCISSRRPHDKKVALKRMIKEGAIISSYESILFELLRYSGNEYFKAISQLVK